MRKINVGQTVGILANVGVIAGIVFLLFELQQNREMMRAQTRNELSMGIVDFLTVVADNGELASLRRRADRAEELTEEEMYRYQILTRALFRYWENVHYQYRLGSYDEAEFLQQRQAWASYAENSKAMVDHWCQIGDEFSHGFAAEMNSVLTVYQCQD